ncbi:hypothetical protein KKF91_11900 [Myxococcota bacterium]|nr:hypothetical protein [Myxococcota bacterium]
MKKNLLIIILIFGCQDKSDILSAPFDAQGIPAMPDAQRALGPGEIEQDPGAPRAHKDLEEAKKLAEKGKEIEKKGAAPVKKLDAYRIKIGDVFVDRLQRQIKIPCKVNMDKGILEYYACGTEGKLHESVLECMVHPSHIHVGALLIGMEPAQIWKDPERKKSDQVTREGSLVKIFVEVDGQEKRPAEDWLYDRAQGKSPKQGNWHFLGSTFWAKQYAADGTKSIIGLVPDNSVVFEVQNFVGNPYRGENLGYEVNEKTIPKKGTPLTLIIEIERAKGAAPSILKDAPEKKKDPKDQNQVE